MTDPLLPHLLDIASDPAAEGLILAGGFGLRLKQTHLQEIGARTLITPVPPARATQDLDFFLSIALFVQRERAAAVRALMVRLDYEAYSLYYQFGKPFDVRYPEHRVKVDFLARLPETGEPVRVKSPRVGSGAGIELHGRETPEAFAVEDTPLHIQVAGVRTDGKSVKASIVLPHPYAWLNMKVKAAHDWLRMQRGEIKPKPRSERHPFDVYVLTAMLTEAELEEAALQARKYSHQQIAEEIRGYAIELYGSPDAPGFLEAMRQAGAPPDHALFWEGLSQALGIP